MIAFNNGHFCILSPVGWGFSLSDGRYYGWRWALHIGPMMISFDPCGPGDPRYEKWADQLWPAKDERRQPVTKVEFFEGDGEPLKSLGLSDQF